MNLTWKAGRDRWARRHAGHFTRLAGDLPYLQIFRCPVVRRIPDASCMIPADGVRRGREGGLRAR